MTKHRKQNGAVLIMVLAILIVVTLVGVSLSKNGQFQLLLSSSFYRFFLSDVLADDVARCVIDKAGKDVGYFERLMSEGESTAARMGISSSDQQNDEEVSKISGNANDNIFGSRVSDKSDNCFSEEDSAQVKESNIEVDEMNTVCGYAVVYGSDSEAYKDMSLVSTGIVKRENANGLEMGNSTVWKRMIMMDSQDMLLDINDGTTQFVRKNNAAAKKESICLI